MTYTSGRKTCRSALSRIGETYGSLTVLDIVGKNKQGNSTCRATCNCGSEREYTLSKLVNGQTKSCGCLSSSKHRKAESRIGETKNNMTLLEIVGKDKNGLTKGRFRCGLCGSEHRESLVSSWNQNCLKSCGCLKKKKQTRAEDHIGIQYNHLTLLKVTGRNKKGRKTGLYQCLCGKQKDGICISRVANGETRSCGCLNNKASDKIGTVWGNLELLEITQIANVKDTKKTKGIFKCKLCDNLKEIAVHPVKSGIQADCGCSNNFHGYSKHISYSVYVNMIHRCTNPLAKSYPKWGGRGVTVHPRWMEPDGQGLKNFMEDIGNDRPSMKHSLHRIWRYEGERLVEMMEYGPDTCKWATSRQQNVEKRSPKLNKRVAEFEKMLEEGLTIDEMAKKMKVKPQKIEFFLSTMGLLEGYKFKDDDN